MLGTCYGCYVSIEGSKKTWQPLIDMDKNARILIGVDSWPPQVYCLGFPEI
jgi:hypothetical protein